jgi:antitoxin CptB
MKELDVLLERYVQERLPAAGAAERLAFEALLESQDPVLYGYCFGSLPPPPEWAVLIGRITAPPSG